MDKSPRQKISKKTLALGDSLGQMDLIDIYRTFYPKLQNRPIFQVYMEHSSVQITW